MPDSAMCRALSTHLAPLRELFRLWDTAAEALAVQSDRCELGRKDPTVRSGGTSDWNCLELNRYCICLLRKGLQWISERTAISNEVRARAPSAFAACWLVERLRLPDQ